jgi:vitamin B12 transporter
MGSAPGFTVDSGPPSVSSLEGVTDADAERIRGAEIGVDAPFLAGRGSVGISLFSTRSRRVATSDTVGVQFRDVVQLFDVEPLETRARGVESWLRLDVSESLGLQLDYVYTRSRLGHDLGVLTQLGLEAGGDAELGIPRHRADVSVRYAPFQTLEGWIAARYVGTRRDERAAFRSSRPALLSGGRVGALFAATEQTTRGAYTTFDLGFSWQLRPGLTLFARVENLFDREYNDPPTTNSPGRAGYLGLQLEMR